MIKAILRKCWCIHLMLLLAISLPTGCKKDRLVDDKADLIGKWEWLYSLSAGYGPSPPIKYFTPMTDGNDYSLKFTEKGKLEFYKNLDLLCRKRMVFSEWNQVQSAGYHSFNILLNNDTDDQLSGSLDQHPDTLTIHYDFPFSSDEPECYCHFTHYFVKE